MRDPKRIPAICNLFQEAWEQVPDQRFGQFLSNMIGEIMAKNNIHDIWFPEDDRWEKMIKNYIAGEDDTNDSCE